MHSNRGFGLARAKGMHQSCQMKNISIIGRSPIESGSVLKCDEARA
jgi:hypothetical protein